MGLLDKVFGKELPGDNPDNGVDPVDNQQDQPAQDIELASYIKKKVEESRSSSARISNEGIWMTNIAYLLGFYGVYFDTSLRTYQPSQNANTSWLKRNRVTANKILPVIQNRLARLCKNPPKYDVRPNSSSNEDKDAARLGLEVINFLMDKNKANAKRQELYMWMQECGHAYVKISWDETMGEPMVDPETGELIGFEGDIRMDVVPALEVFPDPNGKTLDECQWAAHAKLRKLEYFKMHYPERGSLVKEEGAWLLSTQYETRINGLNVRGQGSTSASQSVAKNSAIEITYYERRSKKYPHGRMITTANGVLLADKELPAGILPLVKYDDVLIGGKYYSESVITHMRPIQDQYNRNLAQRSEWTNKLLAGKYMAPKGHGIIQESFDDTSGEIIEYNPGPQGQKPESLQVPVIPNYAYTEDEKLDNIMNGMAGINEVSQGQLPSAGIPAIGMQFLMEQDQTRIGVVTENNENGWAEVASIILKYVEKFYVMDRVLKIAGPGLEYAVKSFCGQDLKGHSDVICIRGSTLPGSKVLRRQEILNLRTQGLLGNPNDPLVIQKVMDMLEYGETFKAWEDVAVDSAQIQKDIEGIQQGIVPEINEFDNQSLHIQKKNLFRKTEKAEAMSDANKAILMNDLENRIQLLMNVANPQLAMQAQNIQKAQGDFRTAQMAGALQNQVGGVQSGPAAPPMSMQQAMPPPPQGGPPGPQGPMPPQGPPQPMMK